MPQDSALYAVARIRSHEKELFGRERMKRLADASPEDALRMLTDAGYGNMPDAALSDVDRMIENQLMETYQLIRELTPDGTLTGLLLMKADIHNLKLLIKLRLTGSTMEPEFMGGGEFTPEQLGDMVEKKDYSALPEDIRRVLEELELGFIASGVDPVMISVKLDAAYMNYAIKNGDDFIKAYFKATVDFDNVLTLLRSRGADINRVQSVLLPGGDISVSALAAEADTPAESLGRAISAGPAASAIKKGLLEVARTGRVSALEKARDDYLMALARVGRNETETIAPVIGFLLAVEQEARCIRLIMTAKRNGLEDNVIMERMRELYG